MNNRVRFRRGSLILGCYLSLLPLAAVALTPSAAQLGSAGSTPPLLREMAGTWSVKEWMWPGPHAKPVALPDAVAYRRLLGGEFLEERMIGLPRSAAAFTRVCFLNYNSMSGRYEYFSIDTRLPQMMNERSTGPAMTHGTIGLYGGTFVAPQWGSAANVPFRYRILLSSVQGGSQTVELYLTPIPAGQSRGFMAFKYIYTRHTRATAP